MSAELKRTMEQTRKAIQDSVRRAAKGTDTMRCGGRPRTKSPCLTLTGNLKRGGRQGD